MSTFCGIMDEFPGISVDKFWGENLISQAFFLSHCHTDHMEGLSHCFFYNLKTSRRFLYASEVSCAILRKMYLSNNLNVIELVPQIPTIVTLETETISVTTIPAGHCPGSVMFLFEGHQKRVLYTGDYRIRPSDVKKFKIFYDSFGKVKSIDNLYLDTTFFLKSYLKFPERTESIRELIRIIKHYMDVKGKNCYINLQTSAFYGYEYCFQEIYKTFNMPVHVNSKSYDFYTSVPEMDKCVTLDGSITQIHSNCGATYRAICKSIPNIIKIQLSAMRWKLSELENSVSFFDNDIHYLCYSTHASYKESMEFVKFLKPKNIEICVKPKVQSNYEELTNTIENVLKESNCKTQEKNRILSEFFDINKIVTKRKASVPIEKYFKKPSISDSKISDIKINSVNNADSVTQYSDTLLVQRNFKKFSFNESKLSNIQNDHDNVASTSKLQVEIKFEANMKNKNNTNEFVSVNKINISSADMHESTKSSNLNKNIIVQTIASTLTSKTNVEPDIPFVRETSTDEDTSYSSKNEILTKTDQQVGTSDFNEPIPENCMDVTEPKYCTEPKDKTEEYYKQNLLKILGIHRLETDNNSSNEKELVVTNKVDGDSKLIKELMEFNLDDLIDSCEDEDDALHEEKSSECSLLHILNLTSSTNKDS